MNGMDRYIDQVLSNIQAPALEKERIRVDIQAHFQAAQEAGESLEKVTSRMGSPQVVAEEYMVHIKLLHAGFWRRLLAFAIDMALLIIWMGLLAVLAIVLSNLVPRSPAGWGYVIGAALIALVIGCMVAMVGGLFLYFPLLEARFGRTLGKRLLGLRVLKENGLPIGYKEAFLRRLSFYFDILPVDALFIPFTEKKQRVFDIIAWTIVIREPK